MTSDMNAPRRTPAQLHLFDLDGRVALVLGLGESGLAMARWAAFRGATMAAARKSHQTGRGPR